MIGWENLEFHELANLFPMLSEEELSRLADEIETNGYDDRHPIVLHEGKILEGRNRWTGCDLLRREGRLKRPPSFVEYEGNDPLQFVLQENLRRRQLTATQKVCLAVELLDFEEEEAKKRQGTRTDLVPNLAPSEWGKARLIVAERVGVAHGYVGEGKAIKRHHPNLYREMQRGEIDLQEAKKRIKRLNRPPSAMAGELPPGQFTVILADPPWRYDHVSDSNDAVENHYPTMTTEEIGELPVADHAAEVCRLFLWATSPKLAEALQVLRAWGFTYTTCAVWVKPSIGPGWVFRQQHELLLVGRKGAAPAPEESDRPSSVIDARKGAHSEKPLAAYELIEGMYPAATRLELFARHSRPGWVSWGNEVEAMEAAD